MGRIFLWFIIEVLDGGEMSGCRWVLSQGRGYCRRGSILFSDREMGGGSLLEKRFDVSKHISDAVDGGLLSFE